MNESDRLAGWEEAEGKMERCRVPGGHIYRYLVEEPVDGEMQPMAVAITFVPEVN